VTALAAYRGTLSVGLGPEPDFGPRKITSRRVDPPLGVACHALLPDPHSAAQKRPYLRAPYLSSKTFPSFRKVTGLYRTFPLSDIAARLAGSGTGGRRQDFCCLKDVLTQRKRNASCWPCRRGTSTLTASQCIATCCEAWVCPRRKATRLPWTITCRVYRKLTKLCWTSLSN